MYNYESSENRGYVKEETQDRTLRKAIFQAWWQKRHRRVNWEPTWENQAKNCHGI